MISSVYKRVAVLLALGTFAATAPLPGQTAGVPAPASVYSFLQKGEKVDYVLKANEVLDVDAQGKQTLVKLDGAVGVRGSLARARKPPTGKKASHLVFYPLGLDGSVSHRRILRDRMVVKLDPDADPAAVAAALGAESFRMFPSSPNRLILNFRNAAETLAKLAEAEGVAGVESVEPLLARQLAKRLIPNDPLFAYVAGPYQWYLQNTGQGGSLPGIDANIVDAWDMATGNGVTVAIVDDGLETEHPDLVNNVNVALGSNWNDGDPADPNPTSAFDTHGTSVAGVAGAEGNNLEGICGTAFESTLVGLRLIAGYVDDADEAAALSWNIDQIQIFNNSWGPGGQDTTELRGPGELTINAIRDAVIIGRGGFGTIYTFAAGNSAEITDDSNYDGYTTMPETIAVGAIADDGVKSSYSEPGANLVVSAPSSGGNFDVTTTNYRGDVIDPDVDPLEYQFPAYRDDFGGTSAATPVVSGVVALMLEENPSLGWRDVQEILMASATENDLSDGGWYDNAAGFHFNHLYGAGMVNATEAVNMAGGWAALPARTEHSILQLPLGDIPNGDGTSYIMQFDFSGFDNLRVEHVEAITTIIHENSADLGIVLISPNGTQSVLAAPHENSSQQSISSWPFMTVRNWGEGSAGIWVLKVTDTKPDNSGTPNILNSVRLRIWGTVDPGAPISQSPLLISRRLIHGIEGLELSYLIETVGADTIIVGDLPPGLDYNAGNHTISGTPQEGGNYNVPITLIGAGGTTNTIINFIIEPIASALGAAVEQPDRKTFSDNTLGSGTWVFEFVITNGDTESVGSPLNMGDNEWSEFGFRENTDGPAVVFYDWKVSSEAGYDRLFCAVGSGSPLQQWSVFIDGETPWRRVGIPMPLANSNPVAWRYLKDYVMSGGLDRGFVNNVDFVKAEDFANDISAALNANFDVVQSGRALWMPIDDVTVPGDARSLVSSGIGDGQAVVLEATLQGPGELTFNWKASAETSDRLTFMVNGVPWEMHPGDASADWVPMIIDLSEGSNIVEWEFRKDVTISANEDRAWLDGFNYLPVVGFESWARDEGVDSGIAGVASDPNADPDFDGNDNFTEYAWGTDPFVPDVSSRMPKVTTAPAGGGSTQITLEYTTDSSHTDLIYTLEQSTTLETWTSVSTDPVLVGSVGSLQTWRYEILAPGDGPFRYFRVKVEQTP